MKNYNLEEVQREFWKHLCNPDSNSSSLEALVESTPQLKAPERLQIYSNAYLWRLQDSLYQDFPILSHLMGQDFENLATDYIKANPSEHYSLNFHGARFPRYLASHSLAEKYLWAYDLAQLEWAKTSLFDKKDHKIVERQELLKLSPESWTGINIQLIAALTLIPLTYEVFNLSLSDDIGSLSLEPNPCLVKVWRQKEEIFVSLVTKDEDEFFAAIRAKKSFGEICSSMTQNRSEAEAAQLAFELLSRWLSQGLIEKIY